MVKEIEVEESYFNNKVLKFIFNSKENVPYGIYLVNMLLFVILSAIFGIILSITGGFEPTVVDKMFFAEVENYNFLEVVIVFGVYIFTLIVSMVEVYLFHKYIEK